MAFAFFMGHGLHAQKKIHILDVFYQALSMDSSESLKVKGQFILDSIDYQEISPSTIINRHPDAIKFLSSDSTMRFACPIGLSGFILANQNSGTDPRIEFKNLIFNDISPNLIIRKPSSPNEIHFGSFLRFNNIQAGSLKIEQGNNFVIDIRNSKIKYVLLAINEAPKIKIDNSDLETLFILYFSAEEIAITNTKLKKVWLQDVKASKVLFQKNTIRNSPLPENEIEYVNDSTTYLRNMYYGLMPFKIISASNQISELQILDNIFESDERQTNTFIGASGKSTTIRGNDFQGNLILKTQTTSDFELLDNHFSTVTFRPSLPSTPQNFVNVDWSDISGKLVWKRDENSPTYYGQNNIELGDKANFNNLVATYSKLIETYKNNRNMIDANQALLEVKELEENRYRYIYQMEGGATNFFRLRLHQLLALYTRHGTNPAQAITASVWLIAIFGLFYFFFPSDWDPKSKTQLIADYRIFIQKNDHGYFIPFLKVVGGVLISLFNAFILSVNSFVTLGFGLIPTRGFAKYVCIIEGFLGWFLLSIFVVSLINQVLF